MHQARKHFPTALIETQANLLISLRVQGEYTKRNCFLCQYSFLFLPTENDMLAGTMLERVRYNATALLMRRGIHTEQSWIIPRDEKWLVFGLELLNSGMYARKKQKFPIFGCLKAKCEPLIVVPG